MTVDVKNGDRSRWDGSGRQKKGTGHDGMAVDAKKGDRSRWDDSERQKRGQVDERPPESDSDLFIAAK
jgi:hypothetical protein